MSTSAVPVSIVTFGHGNLSAETFRCTLRRGGVQRVVDVRSYPMSRRFPWFARDRLEAELDDAGIRYDWLGRVLGGKRRQQPEDVHRHPGLPSGLAAFAHHMETDSFAAACGWLVEQGRHDSVALLCSELDPARCHRWLIADFLVCVQRATVQHYLPCGGRRVHDPSPQARLVDGETLRYDQNTTAQLWHGA